MCCRIRIIRIRYIIILMSLLFCISCSDNINLLIQENLLYLSEDAYLNEVPIDFELSRKHIEDAIDNLPSLQINGYNDKSIEYVKPLESEGERVLWLVHSAANGKSCDTPDAPCI